MKKILFLLLLLPSLLEAQTVRADRFTLNTGPCTFRSGSGAPSGGLGVLCDTYLDTATGILWLKQSGGWVVSGLSGTGTVDTVAKWTSSSALGNSTIVDVSGGNMTLAPAGDLITNPTGNDILPTTGYDINIGALTTKYLALHAAELWVETLVAQDTMATIGGRVLVSPTTTFVQNVGAADTTIHVKHNQMVSGDRAYSEANATVEFFAITSSASAHSGHYDYTVTRNLDGSGANGWSAGDALLNTGTTGNGFIDLYSLRGVKRSSYVDGTPSGTEIGPTIVGNVRLSSTFNDWSPRWAIGNLNGLYGYSGSTYGAAFGVPTGARVTVDSTNGIIIYGGDNDPKVTIDTSGNATFDGKLTVGTGRNQIRNSECRVSTEDWATSTNSGLTIGLSFFFAAGYSLNDESNTCFFTAGGTPANGTITLAYESVLHPVQVGVYYEASAYLNTYRTGNTHVDIQFLNAAGTVVGTIAGTNCAATAAVGTYLVNYCRSGAIGVAPATSANARLVVSTTHNGSGLDPYIFWVRSYLGEASSTQEDLTEWGPAGITEITGGMIKTDAIVSRTIAADAITSAKIAANTIVAGDIATGTITADRMNVSTLSAITADLGSITAGSITGVTATFGSAVTLNSSGIEITSGSGTEDKVRWTDGSAIYTSGGLFQIQAPSSTDIVLAANLEQVRWTPTGELWASNGDLGTSSVPWSNIFVTNARVTGLGGSGTNRFVCHDNDGDLYSSATTCDGSAPASSPEVLALQREVQELREQIQQLMALIPGATPATAHLPAGAKQ